MLPVNPGLPGMFLGSGAVHQALGGTVDGAGRANTKSYLIGVIFSGSGAGAVGKGAGVGIIRGAGPVIALQVVREIAKESPLQVTQHGVLDGKIELGRNFQNEQVVDAFLVVQLFGFGGG